MLFDSFFTGSHEYNWGQAFPILHELRILTSDDA